ncbi:xylose isomerase [Candidatus Epulonipiscium fishelsonii]|uniref:Xylose isomerase n=1 Tax=Candidatus Epulonipiscium fishelsonii TaxID=77094 RepID=A0ACC8XBK8_9FIRM|nr:xylose isomerase [Epulopiscium sp. SCG-B11WGA-EpuloA1]ONI41298.1 xylose isomerase [Epulopiscium sp. SCG-B05WGA-EpuloA1]
MLEKISVVKFEEKESKNPFSFKFYNADEVILGKPMKDHLKFSMSYWHTLCGEGTDPFGKGTIDRTFKGEDELSKAKSKADVAFELMSKLGIEYFCFHDVDIAPEGNNLAELKANVEIMTDYIKELMNKTGIKLLWGTANCFSHQRYMHGAGSSCNADVFAFAAAQIKNAIDATIKLGGTGYVFWGGREGYETLLNTDMGIEQDNIARLMHMAVDYARAQGFKGDFYIEPKPKEPTKHQYDFDVATTLSFLRKYGLDKDFKMNIEANHATLAGHSFQHELHLARVNGVFGSVDANQGDLLLGWDTDQFPSNVYEATMCMYEIIQAGGFTNGGLNFDAKVRRASFEYEDIIYGYILGMDTFALGLRIAAKLIEDGRIKEFTENRYSSYKTGIGEKIVKGKTTLEELEKYALELGEVKVESGRQEYLESIINSIMFSV